MTARRVDQAILSLWKEGENPTKEQIQKWVGDDVEPEEVEQTLKMFEDSGGMRVEDGRYVSNSYTDAGPEPAPTPTEDQLKEERERLASLEPEIQKERERVAAQDQAPSEVSVGEQAQPDEEVEAQGQAPADGRPEEDKT